MDDLTKNPTPTLTDDVEEFEEKQNDFQAMYNTGGHFKEQLESIAAGFKGPEVLGFKEKAVEQMTEIPSSPEVSPEIEGYMEKIEKDPELQKALADDYVKTIGMQSATTQNPQVKIPLTDDQIQAGLHHKVWEAVRWLAEWCVRQMKMLRLKHA